MLLYRGVLTWSPQKWDPAQCTPHAHYSTPTNASLVLAVYVPSAQSTFCWTGLLVSCRPFLSCHKWVAELQGRRNDLCLGAALTELFVMCRLNKGIFLLTNISPMQLVYAASLSVVWDQLRLRGRTESMTLLTHLTLQFNKLLLLPHIRLHLCLLLRLVRVAWHCARLDWLQRVGCVYVNQGVPIERAAVSGRECQTEMTACPAL